jgi:hypothetical protein
MNRYAYVLNNPISLLDPSGLEGGSATCATDPATGNTECSSDYPSCTTDPDASGCNSAGNSNCAAQGTEGCISWPCWMVPGCASKPSGPPPSSQNPGSGPGAPNKNPSQPAKPQSPLAKYGAFLGCYYNSVIETVTDEEDGQGPTAYGFINAGAIASIKYKVFNPIGLTFVATAAIMDTSAMVKANIDCTEQVYH